MQVVMYDACTLLLVFRYEGSPTHPIKKWDESSLAPANYLSEYILIRLRLQTTGSAIRSASAFDDSDVGSDWISFCE